MSAPLTKLQAAAVADVITSVIDYFKAQGALMEQAATQRLVEALVELSTSKALE